MPGTALAIAISPTNTPYVAAASSPDPVQHHNAITATTRDVAMGSITNNSGRNITDSAAIVTAGLLPPGSHGNNDEYSLGLEFLTDIPVAGKTVVTASLTLFVNATYPSPGVIKLYISAHDADTPAALSTTVGDLRASVRPRTTATTIKDVSSVTASQPIEIDVSSVIQELLDRPGWTATRIVMLVDTHEDTSVGEWQDFDHFPVTPAELDIWTSD